MPRPPKRQRDPIPTYDYEMDVIALNDSVDNHPSSRAIDEVTLPLLNQKVSANNLEVRSAISKTSPRSTRRTHQVTNGIERLYMATDVVLVMFAIVIVVSAFVSLGIFIFGQYTIGRGIDDYLMAFKHK